MKPAYFLVNLVITLLAAVLVYLLCNKKSEKIVVVDAIRLFNSYKMKTDLEQTDESRLRLLSHTADSLEAVFKAVSEHRMPDAGPGIADACKIARMNLQSAYETSNKEINQQVWTRLNALLYDYGKANHIAIMVGANGMGTVLYNDPANDITEAVIKYVNNVYENKK